MNRIVREHYPVANLPEDLREGLEEGVTARVVVEIEPQSNPPAKPIQASDLKEMRRRLLADGRPSVSMEEAVARIRELRDEWDY